MTPVMVVGAGIGGLAAALAIARTGRPVHVLEQADVLAEIGAGIQLAPNALRVLDRLGLLDRVYQQAVFPERATMRDATTARTITSLAFDHDFVAAFGYPYVVTHRADLHGALVSGCSTSALVTIETGRRVVAVTEAGDRVRLTTDGGYEYEADAVIGADGLHSVVRQHILGRQEPLVWGDVAYRGTVEYGEVAERDGKDDMTWWVGPGMHLIQYPLRAKGLFNNVAVFSCRSRDAGSADWGGVDELDGYFVDKHPLVRQGVSLIGRDRRWTMVDREPVDTWSRGRVTLLGDAAHPMLQYLAQGGCQALEDAWAVARHLAKADDPASAFLGYQAERSPHTERTQFWARRMGEIAHADGVTAILRDALLGQRAPNDLSYFAWLYGSGATA